MPLRDAPPMPPKNDSGTDTTSAHGHDTTRNVSARLTQSHQLPTNSGGIIASISAAITTQGV